jgi:hypothetical protein
MSAPQIIRTPSGEELVVLPRAEYEALLERANHEAEDADDAAIYDARKAELAAGGVLLPSEVSAAILRGESRLKAIRNWRGETQLHLNFRTGTVRSRKWASYGNPRDHREARAGSERAGGVAFVGYIAYLNIDREDLAEIKPSILAKRPRLPKRPFQKSTTGRNVSR